MKLKGALTSLLWLIDVCFAVEKGVSRARYHDGYFIGTHGKWSAFHPHGCIHMSLEKH